MILSIFFYGFLFSQLVENCYSEDPQCWIKGICEGGFLDATTAPSPEACLRECKGLPECEWFTFDKDEGNLCLLLKDCETLDEDCSNCLSGQKDCTFRGKKLLVGTGYNFDRDATSGHYSVEKDDLGLMEVVHIIDGQNGTSNCDNLPTLEVRPRGAFGATLGPNQIPTICGGYLEVDYSSDCYQLKDLNTGWEKIDSMKERRGFVGSTVLNGSLWVTGGYPVLNTSEILVDEIWIPGPKLPQGKGIERHCLLAINESTAFLVGGSAEGIEFSSKTWFYNLDVREWIQGPSLQLGRYGHACGVLRDESGFATKVVAASGYGTAPSGLLAETEILDLESNSWSFGPLLRAYGAGMAEDGEGGLLLVGGRLDDFDRLDTIYHLRDGFDEWILLPQILKTHREYPVTFIIPDHLTNCY